MALKVVDRAMQSFGAEGISQDTPLAQMYAGLRTLRYADVSSVYRGSFHLARRSLDRFSQGPDEVHIQQIGERELKRADQLKARTAEAKRRETALFEKYNIKAHL